MKKREKEGQERGRQLNLNRSVSLWVYIQQGIYCIIDTKMASPYKEVDTTSQFLMPAAPENKGEEKSLQEPRPNFCKEVKRKEKQKENRRMACVQGGG
jgi:hypothetical protein